MVRVIGPKSNWADSQMITRTRRVSSRALNPCFSGVHRAILVASTVHDVYVSIQPILWGAMLEIWNMKCVFEGISTGVHGDIDLLCSNFKQSDTIGTLRALLAARTKTTTLLQPPSTYWLPSSIKWLKLLSCFNHCESIWLGTLDLYYYLVFGRIWWIIISQGFHVSKRLVQNGMHQTPFWLKVSSVSHGAFIFLTM